MADLENKAQGTPSVYDLPSLVQARGYLEALADGMDPITGQPVDPETLSSQSLRTVLRYASQVLADCVRVQEIRTKKVSRPFFLTPAQLTQLYVKDRPCLVSDIAAEVNRVSGKKFQASWITAWLQEQGYLQLKDGIRSATAKGNEIGITTELRVPRMPGNQLPTAQDGYYVNRYSRACQRFILDHMEDIVEFHNNGVPVARVDFETIVYPIRFTVREFLARQTRFCLITASGTWSPDTGLGSYTAGLCYRDNWKVFQQDNIQGVGAARCILQGVLDAAKMIKKPTEVLLLLSPDPSYTDPKDENYVLWKEILETLARAQCSIKLAVCQSRGDEIARMLKIKML